MARQRTICVIYGKRGGFNAAEVRDARVRAAQTRESAARQVRDEKLRVKEQQRRAKEAVPASHTRAAQRNRLRSWTTDLWTRVTSPHRRADG